jgi:hypothetical protein
MQFRWIIAAIPGLLYIITSILALVVFYYIRDGSV